MNIPINQLQNAIDIRPYLKNGIGVTLQNSIAAKLYGNGFVSMNDPIVALIVMNTLLMHVVM